MIGGGCTFLKLARKVDEVKETLENDEQKVRPTPLPQVLACQLHGVEHGQGAPGILILCSEEE